MVPHIRDLGRQPARGKQRAVMLLQICKRAEEERQHIEKDLFNAQKFYERELELYEASTTSLKAATRYDKGASALLQKQVKKMQTFLLLLLLLAFPRQS